MDDPRTRPLLEWNRLAQENAENAIVSSMFEATSKASEPLETFSTWLLVGTAAVASFLISGSEKLLPLLGQRGFVVSGAFLCLSCAFGLLAKIYAVRCKIGLDTGAAVRTTFIEHAKAHAKEEARIQEGAKYWGIELQTGLRLERILGEYMRPFPKWMAWLAARHFKKNAGNPQIGYLLVVRSFVTQSIFMFLQALMFLGFLIAGLSYAAI